MVSTEYSNSIEVREMKKRFYEEPEVEVMIYGFTNIITGSLDVEDSLDQEDDDFIWGGIY